MAGRRQLGRDGRVGGGAEPGHLRVPGSDPLPRRPPSAADRAGGLPTVLRPGREEALAPLYQERRPPESGGLLRPGRRRRRTGRPDRSQRPLSRRHDPGSRPDVQQNRLAHRLHAEPRRLRLAADPRARYGYPRASAGCDRMGEGVRNRLAWGWLLLQPLPRARQCRRRLLVDERGPSGLFPRAWHAAGGGPSGIPRSFQRAAFPHGRHHGRRALRRALRERSRAGQGWQRASRAGPPCARRRLYPAVDHVRRPDGCAGQRGRSVPRAHEPPRAQSARRAHRSRRSRRSELGHGDRRTY